MSPTLVIAAREIRERRFILVTAIVLGILPFAFFLVPRMSAQDAHDARDLTAMLLSLAFPPAVALGIGASVLGRDLGERRIGFYFARPISALGLWAGKCLGVVALIILSVVLVAGPIVSVKGLLTEFARGAIPFPLRLLAPGLFVLVAVGASVYRSRSPLLVLDVAFAITALLALGTKMRAMAYAGAAAAFGSALPVLAVAFAAVLLIAPAFQIAVGRVDVRRGQAALSLAASGMGAAVLVAFLLWSRWVLGVTPQQAGGVAYGVAAAPITGTGIVFNTAGHAGYSPVFIMDGSSGAYVRFSSARMSSPTFAPDGRAVWFARRPEAVPDSTPTLAIARFDRGRPSVDEVDLPGELTDARVIAVDRAGARAVLAGRASVMLVDMASGRTVGSVSLPGTVAADVEPDGRLRLLQELPRRASTGFGASGFAVSDWDPSRPSVTECWRYETEGPSRMLVVRGDRAFVTSNGRDGLLIDLRSGDRTPVETPWTRPGPPLLSGNRTVMLGAAAQFLSDGQLALGARNEVRLVGEKGTRLVSFGEGAAVWTIAETVPGELAVGVWGGGGGVARRTVFVDTATGRVRREENGLTPAGQRYLFFESGGRAPEAGSLAARLFIDEEGALIERRPDGSRRVLVAAPEP